ncbi:putative movement protein [Sweet potato chlorotic stunt virus]|uniref:Putative movement protein n=1 Tax=Sweet potato chlorotic stunt virus TaxID=81931 RepID=Q8JJW3_9CLOS|nr:putative movement protein [Sweet potato chlorotic stunt virus]CAD21947.1 putative movement protein [Sweet potato chlorotic stunt virus]
MSQSIIDSDFVTETFRYAFKKTDVRDKLERLNEVMKDNLDQINRNKYSFNFQGQTYNLSSNYQVRNGVVHVNTEAPLEVLKLLSVYMYYVEPKYIDMSPYSPESLFGNPNYMKAVKMWKPYYDKSMNEYLNDRSEVGCLYTMDDIDKNYPTLSQTRKITLYRVCNSLGKLVDLKELSAGVLKAFEVKTSDVGQAVMTTTTDNALFGECVKVFKDFIVLNSTKAGKEKIEVNRKFLNSFLRCLSPKDELGNLGENPLLIAWFMREFTNRTKNSKGYKDNFKAVVDLSQPMLKFLKDVFLKDLSLDEDSLFITFPKNSVVEIVDQVIPLAKFHRNQALPKPMSNSCDLPRDVDELVSKTIAEYLGKFVKTDEDLLLDAFLFVLGRCTTNQKRWTSGFEIDFKILGERIKFDSKDLWYHLVNVVRTNHPRFRTNNLIRQWANNRGDRARAMFKICEYHPGLFGSIPRIDNHMRFDFFKLLNLRLMSESEKVSYYTLRLMTESKSNNSDKDFCKLVSWISAN